MSDTQLTPSGIATTSFADKAKDYSDTLEKKTKAESEIEGNELAIKQLLNANDVKIGYSESDLLGLEEKLKVFKPEAPEPERDGLAYVAARTEGRAFSEIVNNPPLFKKLSKKLGVNFEKLFKEVDDVFHQKDVKKEPELDKEKTDKLVTDYKTLVSKLVEARVDLKNAESTLKNIEKYVAFCKELGTLAGKPQGKDQKQDGQQQKQG